MIGVVGRPGEEIRGEIIDEVFAAEFLARPAGYLPSCRAGRSPAGPAGPFGPGAVVEI